MQKETITRIKLIAEEGKVLTDGKRCGREIFLSVTEDAEKFYEITDEEYQKILEESEEVENG